MEFGERFFLKEAKERASGAVKKDWEAKFIEARKSHFGSRAPQLKIFAFVCGLSFVLTFTSMVRRGWRAVETPPGWFNVIRGPQPPSERWPMAQGNRQPSKVDQVGRGRWGHQGGGASRTQSSQPERVRTSPEATIAAARQRVAHLGGALAAFGDATGPEVTMLQNSLKVAKKAAQEPPMEVQLSLCESFVSRAQKRLVAHDDARELLAKELDEGERRSDGESTTPTCERCGVRDCCVESEVGVGGGREERCNGREASETCRHRPPVSGRDDQRPSRAFTGGLQSTSRFARCNVDRECHRSIEVVPRYGRCSHVVFEDSLAPVPLGQYRCVNVRGALYGLRGVRVGEAQNPGPAHAKLRRRVSDSEVSSTFLDGFEADLRNDVTHLSPTVPASSGAIARFVGRSFTPVGVECECSQPTFGVGWGSQHNEFSSARDPSGFECHPRVFDPSFNSGSPDGRTSFQCPLFERFEAAQNDAQVDLPEGFHSITVSRH